MMILGIAYVAVLYVALVTLTLQVWDAWVR